MCEGMCGRGGGRREAGGGVEWAEGGGLGY